MLSSPLEVYSGDKLVIMCGDGESAQVLPVVSSFITVRLSTPRTRNRLVNKYHVSVSFQRAVTKIIPQQVKTFLYRTEICSLFCFPNCNVFF